MAATPGPFEKRKAWLPRAQETVIENVEQAQEYVAEMFVPHRLEVLSPRQDLQLVTKTSWYGDTGLIVMDYNTHVQITPEPLSGFVLVQIPLAGAATLRVGGCKVESSPSTASIPAQDAVSVMQWYARTPHLCVYVKQERVDRIAAELYGVENVERIRLNPSLDLRTVEGQRFKQAILEFHQDLQGTGGLARLARLSEESLVGRMLAASVNSLSQALDVWPAVERPPATAKRRTLAHEFAELIDKHYAEDVSISDFAERLNVSMRALQLSVAAEFETTPSGLLLTTRLEKVHALLQHPMYRQVSIGDLALKCGFSHQGRFSAAYKRHYGQTPSQTRQSQPG